MMIETTDLLAQINKVLIGGIKGKYIRYVDLVGAIKDMIIEKDPTYQELKEEHEEAYKRYLSAQNHLTEYIANMEAQLGVHKMPEKEEDLDDEDLFEEVPKPKRVGKKPQVKSPREYPLDPDDSEEDIC